jgi:hypothetical protein
MSAVSASRPRSAETAGTGTALAGPAVGLLRRWLALDAVVTGLCAVACLTASGPAGRLLGVGSGLLLALGGFLLVYAAAVGWLAARRLPPAFAVSCVVEANVLWALASMAALALWLSPSTTGTVWIPLQAATVAGFAALQYAALRAARADAR